LGIRDSRGMPKAVITINASPQPHPRLAQRRSPDPTRFRSLTTSPGAVHVSIADWNSTAKRDAV
jgi:hypothetical protein